MEPQHFATLEEVVTGTVAESSPGRITIRDQATSDNLEPHLH